MESAQATGLQNNIRNIYAMAFFQSAMIVTAVFVPIMQRHGLNMSQVLLTQAVFALVVAVAEVPSGYLADLWGRKNTIVLGNSLCVMAFFWLVSADSFVDFLLYEILMGVGISLNSGADLALLYDSQNTLNAEHRSDNLSSGNHIARLVAIQSYAGGFAAIAASLLTHWSLNWVLYTQSVISVAALGFALRLVEAPRRISVGGHRDNIQKVLQAVFHNPVVLWTALAIIVFGLAALYAFWIYQKYWEQQNIPVAWFGYIWAMHCILRGVTANQANVIEKKLGTHYVLLLMAVLPIAGFIGMGTTGGWIGLGFGLLCPISRGLNMVVFYDALNRRTDADFRATINSLVSLGTRGLFIVSGPVLGYLIDTQGVNVSLLALAALFVPMFTVIVLPLIFRIRHERTALNSTI